MAYRRLAILVVSFWSLASLFIATGCGARPIRPDDPLAERLDSRRYLALPTSGADHGFPNVFGPEPVLATGVQVRVVEILRHRDVYFVRFAGPRECAPYCTLRIEPADGALALLDERLVVRDPLGGLGETAKDLIGAHEIAAGMSGELVRLSLGVPDRIEADSWLGSPAERWVYYQRSLDENDEVRMRPRLALTLVANRLVDFDEL